MKTEILDINEIRELILSYAKGDFSRRIEIKDEFDDRDSLISAINMLGEELEATVVSRDYLSSIYNAVSEMIFVLSTEGEILDMNLSASNGIPRALNSIIGIQIGQFVKCSNKPLETYINQLKKSQKNSFAGEAFVRCSGKKQTPVVFTLSKIFDEQNVIKGFLVVTRDVTDQKNTEKLVVRTIVDTQEKERKRLANDLHDSLAQELNAVKMYLNVLESNATIQGSSKELFGTCSSLVDQSIANVKNVVFDLLPAALDQGNIYYAIREFSEKMNKQKKIRFDYRIPDSCPKIDAQLGLFMYRIIQEFVNNSMKYASPKSIIIQLNMLKNHLVLHLKDNGKGFNIKDVEKGHGLENIKSRIQAFNGVFHFSSIPGKGTILKAKFLLT